MFKIRRFIQLYHNLKLHEYFQLPNDAYKSLIIRTNVEDLDNIHVYFDYKKVSHCPSFQLPPELVNHIKQYLPEHKFIHVNFKIPMNYPFEQHRLEILCTNMDESTQLINELNTCYWSPAITIDKDILILAEKILLL